MALSFGDLSEAWRTSDYTEAGVSDSGLGLHIDRVIAEVNPKVLIVERRFSDVLRSFENYMSGVPIDINAAVNYLTKLHTALAKPKGKRIRRIPFDDLNDLDKLSSAMQWLVPCADFSHLSDLMEVNIQVSRQGMLADLPKAETHWLLQ